MKTNLLIILIIWLACPNISSQPGTRNDWDVEELKGHPSEIQITLSVFDEKFGEMTEEQMLTVDLSFNTFGYYLNRQQKMAPGKKLTKVILEKPELRNVFTLKAYQGTYYYPFKYGYSVFLDFESGIRPKSTSEFSNTRTVREYDDQNRCIKIQSVDGVSNINTSWIYSYEGNLLKEIQEYTLWNPINISRVEYKNNFRDIIVRSYSSNGSLLEIMEYIYTGMYLTEIKHYNKDGILESNSRFNFDSRGNLMQTDEYINKEHDRKIYYSYNEKNHITKETQVKAKTYQPESAEEQMKDYYWYKYEYYPDGLLRKLTKIHHGLAKRDGINYPNDYAFEMWEYKYDEAGNWIEKIIWEDDYKYNKLMQKYRIYREIAYFNL